MATINGDNSDNTLTGTNDDDTITGNGGSDIANGGGGNDVIFGDDGDQTLPAGSLDYVETFDSGATGWTPSNTDNTQPFFGSILGQFGGTSQSGDVEVSTTIDLDNSFNNAIVEFVFHRLDSWDNHDFKIFSGGQEIFSQNFGVGTDVGQSQTTTIGGVTYETTFTSLGDAAENGFWVSGAFYTFDQSFSVRIEIQNAPDDLDLGFGSTLDQSTFDESYGLDDFVVVSTDDLTLDPDIFVDIDDTLSGGAGDDTIYGEEGNDSLSGDAGNDELFGGIGDDQILGGAGQDTITGGDGQDTINAGDDADVIIGAAGDVIDGGEGGDDNDTLIINDAGATIAFSGAESGTVTFSNLETLTFTNIENVIIPCLTTGTLIKTDTGERPVEDLRAGDLVETYDNGLQPIKWIGRKDLTVQDLEAHPELRPILIRAGALGENKPARDMKVSPQHRMMIGNSHTQLFFGEDQVLAKAKDLTHLPGVERLAPCEISYFHAMFECHELILAENAWTESFQPGDMLERPETEDMFAELFELFPALKDRENRTIDVATRRSLKAFEAKTLVA